MKRSILTCLVLCTCLATGAQPTFPFDGIKDKNAVYTLLKGATVHRNPAMEETADVLIYKNRIVSCSSGGAVSLPENTVVVHLDGYHLYPSFVDMASSYGMPVSEKSPSGRSANTERATNKATYWNEAIHPETDAAALFKTDSKAAASMLQNGIGVAHVHHADGIARGTGCVVGAGSEAANAEMLLSRATSNFGFNKGSSGQNYPSSVMGAVALLRQSLYDAQWYGKGGDGEVNYSLEALDATRHLPAIFHSGDTYDLLRAQRVAREFNMPILLHDADGTAYRVLSDLQPDVVTAILAPLKMPQPFNVSDPDLSRYISQSDMLHWERAIYNPFFIRQAGFPLVLLPGGFKDSKSLFETLQQLRPTGLSRNEILAALTTIPASLLGVGAETGQIEPGMLANFFITGHDIFSNPETPVYEHWIGGQPYVFKDRNAIELAGEYDINVNNTYHNLKVSGKYPKYEATVTTIRGSDTLNTKAALSQIGAEVSLQFANPNGNGHFRLSASSLSNNRLWDGLGLDPDGKNVKWSAIRKKSNGSKLPAPASVDSLIKPPPVWYPYTAYAFDTLPEAKTTLIENATIWTNEADGILTKASILIHEGKIKAIGRDLSAESYFPKGKTPAITRIDASGRHVTPGIIDEHSHIAISRGVNEGTQASTAEVRIMDALYPDDINIYRQLAGGVTCAQLLHGSANPIGGQSAIVKLRWGRGFEGMLFKEAPPFIKFALGENVKQSNRSEAFTSRYPQTRMGVEQFFYEYFLRAQEYGEMKKLAQAASKGSPRRGAPPAPPFRTDLELEALIEILQRQRYITCHSYVQSEINMLMHLADSLGFTLNTFTHILEGYKVADKLKAHGAAASSFSDWWAYKYEVKDAIPHNASILNEVGVVTAINSDDAEMARRLNQEAAKGIKYGGMSEEDALKMVTLNPAKMLHLDEWVGSLAPGKHADLVIWSGHPLSVYSKAEMTFIDGIPYFDRKKSAEMELRDATERARIAGNMLKAKNAGADTRKPERKMERYYHCDSED